MQVGKWIEKVPQRKFEDMARQRHRCTAQTAPAKSEACCRSLNKRRVPGDELRNLAALLNMTHFHSCTGQIPSSATRAMPQKPPNRARVRGQQLDKGVLWLSRPCPKRAVGRPSNDSSRLTASIVTCHTVPTRRPLLRTQLTRRFTATTKRRRSIAPARDYRTRLRASHCSALIA